MLWVICLTLALVTLVVRGQLKKKGKRFWLTRLRGLCVCIAVAVFAAYNFGFDLVPQAYRQRYCSMWQLVVSLVALAAVVYVIRQRSRCNPVFLKGWVVPVCVDLVLAFGALGLWAFCSLVGIENIV